MVQEGLTEEVMCEMKPKEGVRVSMAMSRVATERTFQKDGVMSARTLRWAWA